MQPHPDISPSGTPAGGTNGHREWQRSRLIVRVVLALFLVGSLPLGILRAEPLPRERLSINDNWRFTLGDPAGNPVNLLYDLRQPQVVRRLAAAEGDGNASFGSVPADPASTNQSQPVIKAWILPAANEFLPDPARHFTRPAGNPGAGVAYVRPDFDDRGWQTINLPHDWAIAGPFTHTGGGSMGRLPSAGIGWYRKALNLPASDTGKSIFLDVDGAMAYATVWLNGQLAGGWPYGYASWRVDLTPYARPGATNELVIRLDNPPNSSRWYPGGGIYRNVWLVKTSPVHVAHWGTYLTTPKVSARQATVHLQVTVDNNSGHDTRVAVGTELYALDAQGNQTGPVVATTGLVDLPIPAGASALATGEATVTNPRLWGPPPTQKPNRYVAVTTVLAAGQWVDRYETPFGIRTLKFDPNSGVWVNGEHIELKGVCNHHDLGALGAALNDRALQRQLEMLADMGCNALRTSHNPPAPEFLELADQMGFLVMDEAFDCWIRQKTPLDFHLIFPDWHEADLRAQIRRDRNCPSVILWSIGNEVGEQYTGAAGAVVAQELCNIVHAEDPTRPTTSAMNWAQPTNALPALLDAIGLNYQGAGIRSAPGKYPAFHKTFPDKLVFGSETASALSSRGEYLFPVTNGFGGAVSPSAGEDRARHQVSAYELYSAAFGASVDKVFASQEQHPYVAGEFVWTGWDYLGEPTPFDAARSSYSGIIDLAGFKKARFFLYQAHWRPDFPMAHLLPHWTWPERVGQVTPVHVFTSGDEAELFLNGQSLGRKRKGPFEYRLRWDDVIYHPGTLKVIACLRGKIWATDEVKTAGEPARLKLVPDRDHLRADGRELSFVTVVVADKNGTTVPRADNRIDFALSGPGEIVATDNGDPTSFEPFPSPHRQAFNGMCLVIVRGKPGQSGVIHLTASSQGGLAGRTSIQTSP